MPSGITVDFVYDGSGARAKKADSTGNTTYYIGDHFEVVNGEEVKYIFQAGCHFLTRQKIIC